MFTGIKSQRGLSFLSLTFLLMLIGFFVLLILKIGPLYLNNNKVSSSVTDLKAMPDILNMTKQQINDSLQKRFSMNYVDHVTDQDISIVTQPGYVKVDIEYERVEAIFGNLNVLVNFHEGFEAGSK